MTQTIRKSVHTIHAEEEARKNASTALEVVPEQSTALHPYEHSQEIGELIPGFYLTSDMSTEAMLALNDIVESYEAVDTVNFVDFKVYDLELICLGVICKKVPDKVDEKTGAVRTNRIVTLIKFRNEGENKGPREGVLSFESSAATEWARRMMMIFGKPGDFPSPVKYLIRQFDLKTTGHTFKFSRVTS